MPALDSPQTVHLTTTGARTGRARTIEILGQPEGDGIVLIASRGGAVRHPAWFHNLLAHPLVVVHLDDRNLTMRARVVLGDERESIWERTKRQFPTFVEYERKTSRVIPIVLLEPVGDEPLGDDSQKP